jgi:hypothetical protein
MPDSEEPADLVVSYIVSGKGIVKETDDALNEALKNGYRVVDVLATEMRPSGASNTVGAICVTVVLTMKSGLPVPYRSYLKA